MIALGLRLTLSSGKEAAIRLIVTGGAVAVGVTLLLITLAGGNALSAQTARGAWLNSGNYEPLGVGLGGGPPPPPPQATGSPPPSTAIAPTTGVSEHPLWWVASSDQFKNLSIDRVDVAATGADSPIPPGMAHLPGPGQFFASPALARLLHTTPVAELANRFPGIQIGVIGSAALPAPNSLIIVVGDTAAALSKTPGAKQITQIHTGAIASRHGGADLVRLQVILAIGALALLFPVLVFIGTATRLSATRREQRFAAMRLVGATPRQIAVIAAVEASVSATAGVLIGFVLFFLLRPDFTNVSFTGQPFAAGDLSLGTGDVLLVAIGVPLAAVAAARFALRRVQISPLGVVRRVTPAAPRIYRLIPLIAGIAELGYFGIAGAPHTSGGQILAYFTGFLIIMIGLVVAGPWLTMIGGRVIAQRTNLPAVLIAGRRLSDNPRGAFRSISGLIIALFVTTAAFGIITTIVTDSGLPATHAGAAATLLDRVAPGTDLQAASNQPGSNTSSLAYDVSTIKAIPGVHGLTLIYSNPATGQDQRPTRDVVSCAQLKTTPALGQCSPRAAFASVPRNLGGAGQFTKGNKEADIVWPSAAISAQHLNSLTVDAIAVSTSGTSATVEGTRTALERSLPLLGTVTLIGEPNTGTLRTITEMQYMTTVVLVASLLIAGCGLAVSLIGGLNDRRRPFSLLRLTGVPLRVLRSIVVIEAAAPLLTIAVISASAGLIAADLFLRTQLTESLRAPGINYYAAVLGGIIGALAIIASTLPIVSRITGPESSRNE